MEIQDKVTVIETTLAEFTKKMTEQINALKAIIQNGATQVVGTVNEVKEVIKNIFTKTGTLEITENKISVTKKELLDYFSGKSKTKKAKTNIWDNRSITALTEALIHFEDNHIFEFEKHELEQYMNLNSEYVSDTKAMQLLGKRILKTSSKEDCTEIIKGYVLIMIRLELQPKGENGSLPNNGYAIIMDWVEISSGERFSVYFVWRSFGRVWDLRARGLSGDWGGGGVSFLAMSLEALSL